MKQIPHDRPLGGKLMPGGFDEEGVGPGFVETNTAYLNKHATEWEAPFGSRLHLHLMFTHRGVSWQIRDRASSVCKVPGRCHRAFIAPAFKRAEDQGEEAAK